MKQYSFLFVLFIAGFFSMSAISFLAIDGIVPDLMAILCVYCGLFVAEEDILPNAWLTGFAKDLFVGRIFCLNALSFFLCGRIIRRVRDPLLKDHMVVHFLLTLAVTFTANFLYSLGWGILNRMFIMSVALKTSFHIALYSAILAPFLIYCFNKLPFTFIAVEAKKDF